MKTRTVDRIEVAAPRVATLLCAVLGTLPLSGRAAEPEAQVPEEARRQLQKRSAARLLSSVGRYKMS